MIQNSSLETPLKSYAYMLFSWSSHLGPLVVAEQACDSM